MATSTRPTGAEVKRWFGTGEHRTRTIEWTTGERYKTKSNGSCGRWVDTTMAKAECVCGWSAYADDRPLARLKARTHRTTADTAAAAGTTPPTATITTYYEVAWGLDEFDCITYPDDFDHLLPEDASAYHRAARKLLEFANARQAAGMYVNGVFYVGTNLLASAAAIEDGRLMFEATHPSGKFPARHD
ncbi:hypothetical protein ACWDUL_38385 [Nocardia niigatensis]